MKKKRKAKRKQNTLIWVIIVIALILAAVAIIVTNTTGSGKATYPIPSCVDTDKSNSYPDGKNYYSTGETKLKRSVYRDHCLPTKLVEYYCNANGDVDSVQVSCPLGCVDGRCRDNPADA